ncbi:Kinesin-like protein KIF15 [Phytophthora citrophthora]|uniref:Kinesin-like protein KIF15 n=1 Tax=Phytophthora citrophthora TaxID=4793 RepID=A0AAD9GZH2_9STRA|nr:Kinesin-like protein KIF15 [Phytophthora citrophthora]
MEVSDANVKVFCRVRPPNERERGVRATSLSGSAGFLARSSSAAASSSFAKKCVTVPASDAMQQTVFLHSKHGSAKTFTFDRVFGEGSSQNDIFEVVGAPITQACLEGYNGTIFAYGQTGSGKTFTMQGPDDVIDTETTSLTQEQLDLRGLVPRVFDYLFDNVVAKDSRTNVQHTFACSFLEIYNERVYDLLDGGSGKDAAGLQLRESGRRGVHVEGLIESVVTNSKKAAELMTVGAQNRRVGQTSMNRESSRSHSVFILQLQTKETSAEGTKIRTSRFNLVDLAGSERQRSTDAAGERLKEAGSINKSLSALGNVIMGLSEQSVGKHRHVHYRDSKLTFLLKDSLGGNSKTFMVATISPAEDSAFETLSTLKFAQRAKMIQNSAVVNEDSVGSSLFLQEEIQRLRRQLQHAHEEIARNIPGSNLLQQGATPPEVTSSQDSTAPHTALLGPCDPVVGARFRELEESFATTAEKSDRLQRSCEYLQLQNGNFQALCTDLKQHISHLKMMLRLRGVGGPGAHDYEPSADAIEWRMKYEEMEERFTELQDELQRSGTDDAGFAGRAKSEVENLNLMLLGLTKQLAFVLRDKHDLQDRLLENESDKDEDLEGTSSQDVFDGDFSARLGEALKQQANEYQMKLDSVASFNACLEEKARETSFELLQMKEREASWSVHQHDLEKQLVDAKEALVDSEKAASSANTLLVREKCNIEKLEMQLKRAREDIRLEFEAAVADGSTANQSLRRSKMLLENELAAANAELKQREFQVREAERAFDKLKVDMAELEEVHQKTLHQLDEVQDKLEEAAVQTARLHTEISGRDNVIDTLKHSEAAINEERSALELKLEESNNAVRKLQEDAIAAAQAHSEAMESQNLQVQEQEQKLVRNFEEKLRMKDKQLHEIRTEYDAHRAKTEEVNRLHKSMVEEKDIALEGLQRQLDDQKQTFRLESENLQHKLSEALADATKLSDEKARVEAEHASAVEEIQHLQDEMKQIQAEKDIEIQSLLKRVEQLTMQTTDLDTYNSDLQEECTKQKMQLSESDETIKTFTQEVETLQQQVAAQASEISELQNNLATAQEANEQAGMTITQKADELVASGARINELDQALRDSKTTMESLTGKLEKAEDDIRDAEATTSRQQEEIRMHEGIQNTLRDEMKNLELHRLELTESLKTEEDSKQCVEEEFTVARTAWLKEKKKLKESISALEKRAEELVLNEETVSARKHELELGNEALEIAFGEQAKILQEFKNRVVEKEDKIRALESSSADLERQVVEQQNTLSKKESEIATMAISLSESNDSIATLKERADSNEAAWDQKTREYKAELEAARGRVQAFEQLVEEKAAAFKNAKEILVKEKGSLKQKLEESEEILAQQTAQLMLEIKQLKSTVDEKEAQLQFTSKSLAELKDGLVRAAEEDNNAKVKELQATIEELESKHKLLVVENEGLKENATAELKEKEEVLDRRRSELNDAEEHNKSVQKALEAQQAAAENALKEAKAKAVSHDQLGQAKRRFLTEKVKLQREIQTLTKKVEMISKENEKLVGHHNSRQKIQHHVKVKEENNRLLDQVRQLTDERIKMQRSLEKLRTVLKEKENIGVESTSNTPASVSPASSTSSKSLPPKKVKRPSLGSASSATASTAASTARAAARLAERGRPLSRSASPGPSKKRLPMSSLLDVAMAMNAESSSNMSLVNVAKAGNSVKSSKSLTLMDVAQQEVQAPKQTLQHLAQEMNEEDRSRIQTALDSKAKEVKDERQQLRSQTLQQTAAELQQEELKAVQVLQAKVDNSKQEVAHPDSGNEYDDDDNFEDELPKDNSKKQKEPVVRQDNEPADEEPYEPPPRTTPSESKESKEFLRAVYRADKYHIREMLNEEVVDANIADQVEYTTWILVLLFGLSHSSRKFQHGWSGLHWAASQNHAEILKLLLQQGAQVNAIDHINGWTALHVAVIRESISCISILLSSGADPRIRDNYGDTVVDCLQAASRKKKVRMLQLLQEVRNNN